MLEPPARTSAIPRLALLALTASLSACARDDDPEVPGEFAVEVVENEDAPWPPGRAWEVGDRPTLEIGSEARGYAFAWIRGAVRLSDGRIVVADGASGQVRLYDRQGTLLSAVGRRGRGPKEFRNYMDFARAAGDSVVAFDSGTGRLSVLGPDGTFARMLTPRGVPFNANLAGVLDNGSFVFGLPLLLSPRNGLSRDTVAYVLVSPDGSTVDTLGAAPGGQYFHSTSGRHHSVIRFRFGVMSAAVAGGGRIVFGATDRYELQEYGPDGTAIRVIRRAVTPQPFPEEEFWQAFEGMPRKEVADIPRPRHRPVLSSMLVDRQDHLWVQDFPVPEADSVDWSVFDPRGAMLGQIPLPANFHPTDIGADYVLGVWLDELDVERVRMYPLRKP